MHVLPEYRVRAEENSTEILMSQGSFSSLCLEGGIGGGGRESSRGFEVTF